METSDEFSPISRPLRILISSTPKTGNTWLQCLLAAMYELPKLGLLYPFNRVQAEQLRDPWIIFHHLTPEPELLAWIQEARPFLLTTVRHPGDTLVSLYHHIHGFDVKALDEAKLIEMLTKSFARVEIEPPAQHTFAEELGVSLAWKQMEMTRVVRYEALRSDPFAILRELARWIGPVSDARIEQAIERCNLPLMRSLAGRHGAFFRSGSVGEWRTALPPAVLKIFESEPYRSQFAELGYTLDENQSALAASSKIGTDRNPFRSVTSFDNGVPIPPIVVDFYWSLDPTMNARWPPITSSERGSFLAWCVGSASERHELCETTAPLQSRLIQNAATRLRSYLFNGRSAALALPRLLRYIYEIRPDLQRAFPNLRGNDRVKYVEWLIRYAEEEHDVHPFYLRSMKASYFRWGNRRHPQDRKRRLWLPKITNFAAYVWETDRGARRAFPDLFGKDRWDFLHWLVWEDHGLPVFREFREPILRNLRLLRWVRGRRQMLRG